MSKHIPTHPKHQELPRFEKNKSQKLFISPIVDPEKMSNQRKNKF